MNRPRRAGLMLIGPTEAMQHQENVRPLEISEAFAGLIGQYVQRAAEGGLLLNDVSSYQRRHYV